MGERHTGKSTARKRNNGVATWGTWLSRLGDARKEAHTPVQMPCIGTVLLSPAHETIIQDRHANGIPPCLPSVYLFFWENRKNFRAEKLQPVAMMVVSTLDSR